MTDASPRASDAAASRWRGVGRWFAARPGVFLDVIAILAGLFLVTIFSLGVIRQRHHVVREIDSYGYFLMGKSFADGQWPVWRDDFAAFRGHVWVASRPGEVMAKYPPGWPALLAIGYRVGGLEGAMWVNPILAIVGALAFLLLAATLFDWGAAVVCTCFWLFSPLLVFYSAYPLSHCADITFVILAMLLASWWGRRRSVLAAFAAGVVVGFLPAIRPTSILIWPAVVVLALAMRWRASEISRVKPMRLGRWLWQPIRRLSHDLRHGRWLRAGRRNLAAIAFVAGLSIMLGALAYYNTRSFGLPWRTGYGLSGEQDAFDFSDWRERFWVLEQGRWVLLGSAAWVLGFAGVALRRGGSGVAWALALWFVPTVFLYTGYYWWLGKAEPAFMRFLLSAAPAWVLGAGFVFAPAFVRRSTALRAIALAVALTVAWFGFSGSTFAAGRDREGFWFHEHVRFQLRDPFEWPSRWNSPWTWQPPAEGDDAVVFARDSAMWTAGSTHGVSAVDLSGFEERHYLSPMTEHCQTTRERILIDQHRHHWLHEQVAKFGDADGLFTEFDRRVAELVDGGRTVFIISRANDRLLDRVRRNSSLAIENTGTYVDNTAAYRITRTAATTSTTQPTTPSAAP